MIKATYTNRGSEIALELSRADMNHELLRCLGEHIAYLETNACSRSKSTDEIERFKFYENEERCPKP